MRQITFLLLSPEVVHDPRQRLRVVIGHYVQISLCHVFLGLFYDVVSQVYHVWVRERLQELQLTTLELGILQYLFYCNSLFSFHADGLNVEVNI